jgi:hypothetical protein
MSRLLFKCDMLAAQVKEKFPGSAGVICQTLLNPLRLTSASLELGWFNGSCHSRSYPFTLNDDTSIHIIDIVSLHIFDRESVASSRTR